MFSAATLLLLSIAVPLVGVVIMACLGKAPLPTVRWTALVITLVTLAIVAAVVVGYMQNVTDGGEYASIQRSWLPAESGIDIQLNLSIDGLTLWLYGLSALLMVSCVLVSWEAITERPALFYAMLLLLEAGCLGVFAARDLILFYVFFEFTLIPLFFLIGIWGSEDRRYAAVKFFVFTLAGSLLTFLGLLAIVFWASGESAEYTFSIPAITAALQSNPMPASMQFWIFLALFAGFAIKVPLFPLHTWLPLAHVQAPTAGSVILAGILLKIGTYGFLRFSIPMLPEATSTCMPWILWLSLAGIIYGALVALAQSDIKRLVAYSSVSHLGFCMLGLFALNRIGTQGAVLQMVNHGLSTGALFALIGMVYERFHTREISKLGGMARPLPILAFFMLLFTFSSIGLPGLNGFAGEIMVLLGMFQRGWAGNETAWTFQYKVISVLALTGVILGAWYMLWLVARTFFGNVNLPADEHHDHEAAHGHAVADLQWREVAALAPLAVFVVWIGVCPQFFLQPIQGPVEKLTANAKQIVATEQLAPARESDAAAEPESERRVARTDDDQPNEIQLHGSAGASHSRLISRAGRLERTR